MGTATIAILGASGVLGSAIARALAREATLRLVGRSDAKLRALAASLGGVHQIAALDLTAEGALDGAAAGAAIVVHAAGPGIACTASAGAALAAGAHALDLADQREAVLSTAALDERARAAGRLVVSGCGAFPGLSGAVCAELCPQVAYVNEINVGLATDGRAAPGAAWRAGAAAQASRKLRMKLGGEWEERQGGGDRRWLELPPGVPRRRASNWDAPELELLPREYRVSTVRVSVAGPERASGLGGFARAVGLTRSGAAVGCLAIWVRGTDAKRLPVERRFAWVLSERAADALVVPAVLLARRILGGAPPEPGARPCLGIVSLAELARSMDALGVRAERGDLGGWKA
jgi:hypothetical protein